MALDPASHTRARLDCRPRGAAGPVEWTQDSKALAYLEPRIGTDIWIRPFDGGKKRQLTHLPVDGQQIWPDLGGGVVGGW
jgi:hypothetical protein